MREIPTTDRFFVRYPTFADMDAELVGLVMEDAVRVVGSPSETVWPERDYAPAILLLTAHLLTEERLAKEVQDAGGSHIAREKVGDVELTYNVARLNNEAKSSGKYGSTEYGRKFDELRRSVLATGPYIL